MPSKKFDAERSAAAHPGSPCRFRPARKPAASGGISSLGAGLDLRARCRRHAGRTRCRSRNAPDRARARSPASGAIPRRSAAGDRCGRLSNHFGTISSALAPIARALAFDLDLDAHERLRRRVDDHRAEPERPGERNRPLEECNVPHGQTWRHDASLQSSVLWVKKCLRMRCTSSVKTGSAIASSERGRGSGTS